MSSELDGKGASLDLALLNEVEWKKANSIAGMCKAIVESTAIKIEGKRYVPVEAWQSIAAAWGCTAATEEPYHVEGGLRCKAILRRDNDGAILSTAYGFVGDDEPLWAKRKQFAREGMVQTRATSRVCAQKFRFIPVLMGIADLSTTPYEEMQAVVDSEPERKPMPPRKNHAEPKEAEAVMELTGTLNVGSLRTDSKGSCWFADLEGRTLWTRDRQIGDLFPDLDGVEVRVEMTRPNPEKPNSYKIISISTLEEAK